METDLSARELLSDLVALPGPPGGENAVRAYLRDRVRALGLVCRTDARGNLIVSLSPDAWPDHPAVVVTAHMDEIALVITGVDAGGGLRVAPLGGVFPWKWGEGPVEALPLGGGPLSDGDPVPGVLSFGSIHTDSPLSAAQRAREGATPTWNDTRVLTGRTPDALDAAGIRPGARVVIARSRRLLCDLGGDLVASFFLDDRADLVAWLLALRALRDAGEGNDVLFAATVSEEVGGEGAAFLLHGLRPDVCVALEIGPRTPETNFPLDDQPTVWVSDGYATTDPRDLALLADAARDADLRVHWQALSRGGSDASSAASRGLCARHATLAFAAENSHGFEIMHGGAPENLARLLVAYLRRLQTKKQEEIL